jgi:threonylcarbamoyladenosine tRNA methylthiotransferase MtaB
MFDQKKVAFYTLGCKLNFSETSTIGRQLIDIGFQKVDFNQVADLYVINTCSVTENANRECRRIIRKARRLSPASFIVVTGCYAQLKPNDISKIEGVDMVLGANDKFNLPKLLKDLTKNNSPKIHGCEISKLDYFNSFSLNDRTRSFLKIQDGCDYPCTYCTIPLARGKSRCDTIDNILQSASIIASKGIKEIVLTGVNIGEFKDNNNNFADLMSNLENVEGIERYRISSIEPNLISDQVISNVSVSKKFMPHFHIPMQSGSDLILGKMKRRYQTKLYRNKINNITNKIKDVCIGADVIVGFPGETDDEFNKTMLFIKDLPISYLHVFTYSERENTAAIKFDNIVDKKTRSERATKLILLSEKLKRAFYSKYISSHHTALLEEEDHDGFLYGFTDNYIKIKVPFHKHLQKSKQKVFLQKIDSDGIMLSKIITN